MQRPRKLVLALSGKRYSGKDSLAAAVIDEASSRGIALRRRALADACKIAFCEEMAAVGITIDATSLIADRATKERWRPALTVFTERELAADPQVFCRQILDEPHDDPVLITDVRLRSEVAMLTLRADPIFARVVRSDESRRSSGWSFTKGVDDHRTETELDDWDGWSEIVRNEGPTSELATFARRLVDRLSEALGQSGSRPNAR